MSASASASAPSTTANLGPGFDAFGMALDAFCDRVTVRRTAERGRVRVRADGGVPEDPRRNTAGIVARRVIRDHGARGGLEVTIRKGVPAGYGMGSSAASAAAAAVALDRLLGLGLSGTELVRLAGEGERASAGTAHYDNAAASVLGGFVIVRQDPLRITRLRPPRDMHCCVAIPDIATPAKKTAVLRSLVPRTPRLADATANAAAAATIAAGFAAGDTRLVCSAMHDAIAEPRRRRMIPGFDSVRRGALRAGALGVAISGAGPSVIAITDDASLEAAIGAAMRRAFARAGCACRTVGCRPAARGAARAGAR